MTLLAQKRLHTTKITPLLISTRAHGEAQVVCFSFSHAGLSGDSGSGPRNAAKVASSSRPPAPPPLPLPSPEDLSLLLAGSDVLAFTVDELRAATRDFSMSNFVGEGGFGPVYKGRVDERIRPGLRQPQAVAVKLLDLEGSQGHKEWLVISCSSRLII